MINRSPLSLPRILSAIVFLGFFVFGNVKGQQWNLVEKETNFVRTDWDNSNGLLINTVFRTAQDRKGFIWMATEEGLVRFDGRTFKNFNQRNTPDISTPTFNDLTLSAKGGIYAANSNALVYADFNDITVFPQSNELAPFRFTAISETVTGEVFLGTQNGNLVIFDGKAFEKISPPQDLKIGYIRELIAFENQLLIGGPNGFFSYDYMTQQFHSYALLLDKDVKSIAVSSNHKVYIGTRLHGLFIFENEKVKQVDLPADTGFDKITAIESSQQDGGIWIGTSSKGVFKILNDQLLSYPHLNTALFEVWDIFEDNQNAIWISGLGIGISRLRKSKVEVLDERIGLSSSVILTTFEDSEKGIWLGTPGSGVNRVHSDEIKHFSTHNGLSHDIVFSVAERDDYIFVGTGNGLNRIHLPSLKLEKVYTKADGMLVEMIYSLLKDANENIWMGTGNGILHCLTPSEELTTIQLEASLSNAEIISAMEDRRGVLWFGTFGNGFFSVNKDRSIEHFPINQWAPSQLVTSMWEDPEGDLWISSADGLLVLANGEFKKFGKRNGLHFESINTIISDDHEMIWLTGNHGVQAIAISDLINLKKSTNEEFKLSPILYDKSDGLLNNEFNGGFHPSAWKLSNGNMLFPSMKGAVIINPTHIKVGGETSFPYIESLNYGGNEIDYHPNIRVPAGMTFFNIKYGNIEYEKPLAIRYYYRIKELGEDWIDNENRNIAYFSGLPPGNYQFQVRFEQFGELSEIATMNFKVEAFFYQTLWFKILSLIFVFILGYIVNALIVNAKLKMDLEEKIVLQTKDLELKNQSLTKALDHLENHNKLLEDIAWTQSHKFRGPLSIILGMIQALRNYENFKDIKLSKEEMMEKIEDSSVELDSILRELNTKLEEKNEKSV